MYTTSCLHHRTLSLIHAIALLLIALGLFPIQANAADSLAPTGQGVWQGTLGKQKVTVCLAEKGKSSYRYQRFQTDIPLSQHGDEWEETVHGVVSGIWTLAEVHGDELEGHWRNPTSQRTLPIRLKKTADVNGSAPCESSGYKSRLNEVSPQSNMDIPGLENVRDIAASDHKACAVLKDGNVKCWGMADSQNKLTLDDLHRSDVDAIAMATAGDVLCTVSRDKTVNCNGRPLGNVSFDNFGHSGPVAVVSPSAEFVCVLGSDGRVQCAGDNSNGQLGDGSTTSSQKPVFVKGLNNAKSIALGWESACAVLNNGHVKCWGRDFLSGKVLKPSDIRGVNNAKSVVVGGNYACALLQNGTVKCWGKNDQGELGNGYGNTVDSILPVKVLGLTGAIAILPLTGEVALFDPSGNTCALLRTGGVKCWGPFFNDAIDHGSEAQFVIPGYVDAVALASGGGDLCSIDRNKTAWCGSVFEYPNTFGDVSKVEGLTDVIKLTGGSHMCALLGNGRVRCWSTTTKNGVPQNLKSVIFDGVR